MTSSSSSSRVEIRRSSDSSSCCIRSRSLGLVISPWSIRSWSRLRRALTCSTSASAFSCAADEVVDDDLLVAAAAEDVGPPHGQRGDLGVLRKVRALVPPLVGRGVELLEVEQLQLGVRVGLHRPFLMAQCPGVGAELAHPGVDVAAERLLHAGRDHRQPGPLGRPVGDVDQCRALLLDELGGRVVPEVAGDVDIDVGRCDPIEQEVAGAAADRDLPDRPLGVAGDPDAVLGRRQGGGDGLGELGEGRGREGADPARAGRSPCRGRRARRRRTPAPRRDGRPASPAPPAGAGAGPGPPRC